MIVQTLIPPNNSVGTDQLVPDAVTSEKLGPGAPNHVVLVAASNAPQKVKDIADYVCDGTGDQAEIQAAIDAVYAYGAAAGIVQLSQGTFGLNVNALSESALTEAVTITSPSTIAVANGALYAVGQMLRFSGGDDGGGHTLEYDGEDLVLTIKSILGNNLTMDYAFFNSYTGVTSVRIPWSVRLRRNIVLAGEGVYGTTLRLAAAQDCDLVRLYETSSSGFGYVRDMYLDGNYANQTAGKVGQSACIAQNGFVLDLYIERVFAANANGPGLVLNHPWGTVVDRCVVEWNQWSGIVVSGDSGGAGNVRITNTKVNNNDKDHTTGRGNAIRINRNNVTTIIGCQLGGEDVASSILLRAANYTQIVGCDFSVHDTGGTAPIISAPALPSPSQYANVNGCLFRLNASQTGISLAAGGGFWAITGNIFKARSGTNGTGIVGAGADNQITGNVFKDLVLGVNPTGSRNSMVGNLLSDCTTGIYLQSPDMIVVANKFYGGTTQLSMAGTSDNSVVSGNYFRSGGTGVAIASGGNNSYVGGNYFQGQTTVALTNAATGIVFGKNMGYLTGASGTATIVQTGTSIVVTHGLAITPSINNIVVTPQATIAAATCFWVSNVTSTQFTINVDVAIAAAGGCPFSWQIREPG